MRRLSNVGALAVLAALAGVFEPVYTRPVSRRPGKVWPKPDNDRPLPLAKPYEPVGKKRKLRRNRRHN